MRKVKMLAALAVVYGPGWLAGLVWSKKRVVIDGRRIDNKALAVGELANFLRPPGQLPTLEESRRSLNVLASKFDLPPAPAVKITDLELPGAAGPLKARIYDAAPEGQPESQSGRPALLYLHGGGWIQGGFITHDGLCAQLALEAGIRVIAPEYRLAPEDKFPAAPDDVLSIWRALAAEPGRYGIDIARTAVGGDSAGGNLAAVLLHDLASPGAEELPKPAGQLLFYPALETGYATGSMHSLRRAYVLPRERMEWYVGQYLRTPADEFHPRFAPSLSEHLEGNHQRVPPTLVIVAGQDPLRDDGIRHVERLEALGVKAELIEYPGQIHAFASLRRVIPEAREATTKAAEWLRRVLG